MATPVGDFVAVPADERIQSLVEGGLWVFADEPVLTYSFEVDDLPGGSHAWIDQPQLETAVEQALAQWAAVANISFQRIDAVADIDESTADLAFALTGNFLGTELGATALGFFPDPDTVNEILRSLHGLPPEADIEALFPNAEGDVYLDHAQTPFFFLGHGGATREVILHEIGHALGLKHPEDATNDRPSDSNPDPRFSVMLKNPIVSPLSAGHASTPLLYDILAIQEIYGANMAHATGNDTYLLQIDNAQRAVWDAGGIDTLDASLLPFGMSFSLEAGVVLELDTRTQFALAFGVDIENAIGTPFADFITGNALANQLAGGAGDDVYLLGDGDLAIENAGEGIDRVESAASVVLAPHIENLRLTGGAAASATGNALANLITGNSGDNTLDGGGGADTLAGGGGNDTYLFRGRETIVDSGGEDAAIAQASLFSVPAGIENVTLGARAGVAWIGPSGADNHFVGNGGANRIDGGNGDDLLEGGRGDDTLLGGAGNDTLDGARGADVMEGGAGDDVYVAGSARDRIVELAGAGRDVVQISSGRYDLAANLEDAVVLYGGGAKVAGNALANVLDGGAGNDTLEGGGGADRFRFDETGNVDLVLDFTHGVDRIVVDGGVFGTDITYDPATGTLFYGGGIQFAQLGEGAIHPAFSAADIQIV